jgi:hypothetical protein
VHPGEVEGVDVGHDLLGPHDLALVGGADDEREQVVGEMVALPLDDAAQVRSELGRGREVLLHLLVGEEGVDELEALPGPEAQLLPVVHVGDAEDIAGEGVREQEPDGVDDPQHAVDRGARQRVVDDLLRASAQLLHRAVAERRRDDATGTRMTGPIGRERVLWEVDVAVGPAVLAAHDPRQPGLHRVEPEQVPELALDVDDAGPLGPEPSQVRVGIDEVLG